MWDATLSPIGTLCSSCVKVCEPSELWFGVVHGVGRGIGVIDGGQRHAKGRAAFGGFCSQFAHFFSVI